MAPVHPMYKNPPEDAARRIARALENARPGQMVFFRADDVAVPSERFLILVQLFRKHGAPLDLAVVPAWLTPARLASLGSMFAPDDPRFCLSMHGFRHENHEREGKKQEFGDSRDAGAILRDLSRGRDLLAALLGPSFFPAFTPPWNRCGQKAMDALMGLGFTALSRSLGARPPAPSGLCSLDVSVDLHTRKEPDAASAWDALFSELSSALAADRPCGVMIHHQRMNAPAFAFLDALLAALSVHPLVVLQNFRGLAKSPQGGGHDGRRQ